MEKPCCVDGAGYRILMETSKLADEKQLLVGVGLQRRHETRYQETVKRIQDGALGDLRFLRVYWNGNGIWNRKREPQMTEMQYQVHNWYHFAWLSGDNIGEQHIHNLDIGNWVMGDQHPVEANGMGGCTARYLGENKGTGQIFDHHFVEFIYKDGTRMYSQCRHMKNCYNAVSETAHGAKASAPCAGPLPGEKLPRTKVKSLGGHQQEQIDLVAALRRQTLQRGLLRRQQQHDRRAGPPGDLLRPGRQVGRRRGQPAERIPQATLLGCPRPGEERRRRQLPHSPARNVRPLLRSTFKTAKATVGQECPTYSGRRMRICSGRRMGILQRP